MFSLYRCKINIFLLIVLAALLPIQTFAAATKPFVCDGRLYQTHKGSGKMELYETFIDGTVGLIQRSNLENQISDLSGANSTAINPINRFMYVTSKSDRGDGNGNVTHIYKIDANGSVEYFGTPKIRGAGISTNFYVGAIDLNGKYWLSRQSSPITIVDMDRVAADDSNSAYTLNGSHSASISDFAFDPVTGGLYGWDGGRAKLSEIQLDDMNRPGTITGTRFIGSGGIITNQVGAAYFTVDGVFIGYRNDPGILFSVDVATGVPTVLASGVSSGGNDGASCPFGLEFFKTTSTNNTTLGGIFSYTFKIVNRSSAVLTDVVFSDLLTGGFVWDSEPYNLTGGITIGSSSITDSANASFNLTSIPLGTTTFDINVRVPNAIPSNNLSNVAALSNVPVGLGSTIHSDNGATTTLDDATNITINIPDITMEKTVAFAVGGDADSSGTFSKNDTVTYTITLTNNGNEAASNITVTDILPVGIAYSNATITGGDSQNDSDPHGALAGKPDGLTWTLSSLPAGGSIVLTFEGVIQPNIIGSLNSQSELTASNVVGTVLSDADLNTPDIFEPTSLQISAVPVITLTKKVTLTTDADGSGSYSPSDLLTYTLTVLVNDETAQNILVSDAIPSGLSYVSGTVSTNSSDSQNETDPANALAGPPQGLEWNIASLNAGSSAVLSYQVVIDNISGQTLDNQAHLTANFNGVLLSDDPAVGGNSDITTITVDDLPTAVNDSRVSTTGISINITVLNNDLDKGDGLASLTLTGSNTTPLGANIAVNDNGTAANPADDYIAYSAHPSNAGVDSFTYRITDVDGDTSDATVFVNVSAPNVSISKRRDTVFVPAGLVADNDGSGSITEGDTLRFVVNVQNGIGGFAALNLDIADSLPTGFINLSNITTTSTGAMGVLSDSSSATALAINIDSMAPESNVTISYDVLVDTGTENSTVSNTATVNGDNLLLLNDTVSTFIGVIPAVSMSKTVSLVVDADTNGAVSFGDTVEYTLTVTHDAATDAAKNISVSDVVPTGLSYVASSILGGTTNDDFSPTAMGLKWTIDTLSGGASTALVFQAQVTQTTLNTINNQASLTGNFANTVLSDGDNVQAGIQTTPLTIGVGAATQLIFTQQPSDTIGGIKINPVIRAEIRDVNGHLVNVNSSITLSINAGTGTLDGTTTVTAKAGVVTFNGIDIDQADTFTLNVSASGLAGDTSTAFTIRLDSDGDGILDVIEIAEGSDPFDTSDFKDTDGDGTHDDADPDADNDGINDDIENGGNNPYNDNDGDDIPDYLDADDRGDGNPASCTDTTPADGVCDNSQPLDPAFDFDQDGIPNHADPDSDNDLIPDAIEGAGDNEPTPDGNPNYLDADSDGDGIPDIIESGASGNDADNDGIDDTFDVDSTGGVDANNDGIDDAVTARDTDNDGIPDFLDADSDNDGIPDALEGSSSDSDNDGIDDRYDVDSTGGTDANNDGIDDVATPADLDGDGIANMHDIDSDADGISDAIESNASGTDTDSDGIDDAFDADNTVGTDSNSDGILEDALPNNDADASPDFLDLDSDNDSIPDVTENNGLDLDANGMVDNAALTPQPLTDTDGDGVPDHLDLDSTNDGTYDIDDAGQGNFDTNNDGQADTISDADHDGVVDSVDTRINAYGVSGTDTDGDGIPDVRDLDADGDGISNLFEGDSSVDTDADGVPDYLDSDSDNDGISDLLEAFAGKRLASSGLDSNANGLDDTIDVRLTGGNDTNDDGVDDHFNPVDSDYDGIPDYLDLDSDNDGVSDQQETSNLLLMPNDSDNDGINDAFDIDTNGGIDANHDGISDHIVPLLDTDNDGLLNHLDRDSDNDNIADGAENHDMNNDGINDRLQKEGVVKTSVKGGAGSTHPVTLLILLIMALLKRRTNV